MGCAGSKAAENVAIPADQVTIPVDHAAIPAYHDAIPAEHDAAIPVEYEGPTAADHVVIQVLTKLDDKLADALHASAAKLLDAEVLRSEGSEKRLPRMLRRQELEAMEAQGTRIFVSANEAVAALRANKRSIAGLTYGWTTRDDPDVTAAYLAAVRRFLRSPLGAHVTAVFWDFPSLPQEPRTAAEQPLFDMALKVMGDVYSSALGTTVIRHRGIPARPANLDGKVAVLVEAGGVLDGAVGEAELHRTLGLRPNESATFEEGRWLVHFASHERAKAAVVGAEGTAGAAAVFTFHNEQPYDERGWTTFESAVSTEALAHIAYYEGLQAVLTRLPPKLIEIDGEGPREADEAAGGPIDEGMGPRVERVRSSIRVATFTSKGDKDIVLGLYGDYITCIGRAMVDSVEGMDGVYNGEYNAAGQREGRGTFSRVDKNDVYEGEFKANKMDGHGACRYADGNVYEGEFKANKMHGHGTFKYADGDVYDGEFKADKKEGRGTYRFANGNVYDGEWKAGQREGRGTIRYANGNVYDGEWKAGHREGRGNIRYANDNVYDGEWKAGQREGRGTLKYVSGDVYQGEWKAGHREGHGTYWYTNGNVYEGEWKAHDIEGRGTFTFSNGNLYEGEVQAGKQEGRGSFRHANGNMYEGEWKGGKREGASTSRPANGNVEVGYYQQGAPVGEGVRWSSDGQQARRLRDGKVVEAISPEEARLTAQRLFLPIPPEMALLHPQRV